VINLLNGLWHVQTNGATPTGSMIARKFQAVRYDPNGVASPQSGVPCVLTRYGSHIHPTLYGSHHPRHGIEQTQTMKGSHIPAVRYDPVGVASPQNTIPCAPTRYGSHIPRHRMWKFAKSFQWESKSRIKLVSRVIFNIFNRNQCIFERFNYRTPINHFNILIRIVIIKCV